MSYKKLWLPAIAFILSFAATYPGVSVLIDETQYLRQAAAFSNGQILVEEVHPISGVSTQVLPSTYPPGTSLIASLFIFMGDWTTAFWMPALALLFAMYFTFLMLRACNLNPCFSLLVLVFPPALIMARVVSSDVISATMVALGWYLFWKGSRGNNNSKAYLWITSGFIAGISILFREPNALLFAPLFAGAMLRRDKQWIWLLFGGLIGLGLRLILSQLIFNDPFFYRDPGFGFSLDSLISNAPVYLAALTVFVPGGLIFGLLYRGERRIEVVTTILLFTLFYLSYDFSGESSGFLKSLILGPRFFIPLLPVLVFATAQSAPYYLKSILKYPVVIKRLLTASIVAVSIAMIVVNIAFYQWTSVQEKIQHTIVEYVPKDVPVVYNRQSTLKFMSELQGYPSRIHFQFLSEEEISLLDEAYIVFVQRSDSQFWRDYTVAENSFLDKLSAKSIFDDNFLNNYHLRILKISDSNP